MTGSPVSPERPLRRDAERNRQRILDAAREVFAEQGLRGSHDEIARRAGVGVGTVYRRFPDKEQLIDALFEDRVAEIAELAHTALAMDDPWEGLALFLVRGQELQSGDRGLKELILGADGGHARVERARGEISPLVERLLDRAQAAGVVRADITVTDLPLIQFALGAIIDATHATAPDTWRRALAIVLDGLRSPDPSPLGAPPLTLEQFDCAMHEMSALRR